MAIYFYVSILLVILLAIAAQETPQLSLSPSPTTTPPLATALTPPPPPPPPTPTPADMQASQLKNIIDALIGAGDFGGWVNALSSADPSAFPLSATFFIPSDDASAHSAAGASFDPFLIPYHIVPQRLTFSDLQQFAPHSHLPTLLPSKYIVITNNSAANFTVDDSQITQPDVFLNGCFSVHGINNILDYSLYGGGGRAGLLSPPPGNPNLESPNPTTLAPPPPKKNPAHPGFTIAVISRASCSSSGVLIILSTLLAVIFIQDSFKFFDF